MHPPGTYRSIFFRHAVAMLAIVLFPGWMYGDVLRSTGASQFFVTPDEASVLHWKMAQPGDGETVPCVITGYDGKVVAELQAKQTKGDVELSVRLPRGFYTLSFIKQNQAFGLVVIPRHEGEKDRFFAIDAALSIFRPLPVRAELIHALDRMGVATARERMLWGDVQTSKETWDWVTKKQYEPTRQLYSESNIGVLELFHTSPAWMQADKKSVFPEDLAVSKKSWEQIASRWGKHWSGLEVWNEADIPAGQGGPQAEQYLPIIKTVRYALQSAGCSTPIGGGVFAYQTRPYMDLAAENGLLQISDFLSFHYYSDPQGLESYIAEYRRYLKDFGRESMPLWLTECGAPWLGNPNVRPNLENDQNTAASFAKLAIEAKACGIQRYFPFVLVAYAEYGNKNFGMLDRQETPVRSMAAYAQVIDALSHTEYVGDIEMPDKAIRARVFSRKDGSAVVVLEGGASGKTQAELPFPVSAIYGIDGRKLNWAKSGPQPIEDGVCFAFGRMQEIKPHLKTETRAMALARLGLAPEESRQKISPVILAPSANTREFTASIRGYEVPETAKELPVKVKVTNLSSKPEAIRVTIQGNAREQNESDRVVQNLTIPAESSTEISAAIKRSAVAFDSQGRGIVRFMGEGVGKILPGALFFATPLGLEQCLGSHAYRFALPISDLTRWETNASGKLEWGASANGTWNFHVVYGPGDKWAFPKFTVPQEVDPDRITGVVVRARCLHPATVRLMTWPKGKTNLSTTGYSIIKTDGEWHVAYVALSDFLKPSGNEKPGRQIGKISVGVSDHENAENTLEISDLIFVGE
ncbi:MAG: hypothetical protein ACFUZC_08835 [Chthoniobacteraceae bacterium]